MAEITPDEALRAYFSQEKFDLPDLQINELIGILSLQRIDVEDPEGKRVVSVEKDAYGEVTASSIKAFNLVKLSGRDYRRLLAKMVLAGGAASIEWQSASLALLSLLVDFDEKQEIQLGLVEARLVWVIKEAGLDGAGNKFQATDLLDMYESTFSEPVTRETIIAALSNLDDLHVLKWDDEPPDSFSVREVIVKESY